jgi:hypothetical protein
MVITVAGVQGVAWLIGPAFMALIVVIAVAPAQTWLRRKGRPTWATTLVVVDAARQGRVGRRRPPRRLGGRTAARVGDETGPACRAEVIAEAERSHADTELAASSVPAPHVEEPGPPGHEPTTRMSHEF